MLAETLMRPLRTLMDGLVRMSQTRSNYWAEFIVDSLLALAVVGAGLSSPEMTLEWAATILVAGLIIFSFIEYVIHRWVFHRFNSPLSQGHDAHHNNPMGYDALPFFLPAIVAIGMLAIFSTLMPDPAAYILTGSIMIGYLIYGTSHHIIHHVRFDNPLAKRWAALHHVHHVHPGTNFGVTTPLWDVLLRTLYVPPRRRR